MIALFDALRSNGYDMHINGTVLPAAKFAVVYEDHDRGAAGGKMVRDLIENAELTADLMRQCGYRKVEIEAVL